MKNTHIFRLLAMFLALLLPAGLCACSGGLYDPEALLNRQANGAGSGAYPVSATDPVPISDPIVFQTKVTEETPPDDFLHLSAEQFAQICVSYIRNVLLPMLSDSDACRVFASKAAASGEEIEQTQMESTYEQSLELSTKTMKLEWMSKTSAANGDHSRQVAISMTEPCGGPLPQWIVYYLQFHISGLPFSVTSDDTSVSVAKKKDQIVLEYKTVPVPESNDGMGVVQTHATLRFLLNEDDRLTAVDFTAEHGVYYPTVCPDKTICPDETTIVD